jgi:hypothetical protein
MAILNQDKYLYIVTYNKEDSKPPLPQERSGGWPATWTRNWDDKDYWYVEFIHGDAFYHYPIEKIVPEEVLNKIKSGAITLCLSHAHEAYHCTIESIYKYVIEKSNIPASSILYLTNSADINKEISHVSEIKGLPKFNAEFISLFELVAKIEYHKNLGSFAESGTLRKDHERKFFCVNGVWRPHRTALISLLHCYDLLNDGYVSYNTMPHDIPRAEDSFSILQKMYRDDITTLGLLSDNRKKLLDLNRIYLDSTPENHSISFAHYPNTSKNFYENSYFTVVTESLCNANMSFIGHTLGRTISEKTFKPILNLHPFILLAVPGTLKLLKYLGYKTFGPFIDESYDDENDDGKRALMIANEVRRLCSLNKTQLDDFLVGCKSITTHNLQVLLSKETFNHSMT